MSTAARRGPSAGLVEHFVLTGDLNGDGRDEAVVLLWENSGGSGTRTYLAAMGRGDGAIVNLGTVLIGDRVQVKTGFIVDGLITLDLIQAGPARRRLLSHPEDAHRVATRGGQPERTAHRDHGGVVPRRPSGARVGACGHRLGRPGRRRPSDQHSLRRRPGRWDGRLQQLLRDGHERGARTTLNSAPWAPP